MGRGIRLIIVARRQDFIAIVKKTLQQKQYIESIITVTHAHGWEDKLDRNSVNLLIVDVDDCLPDIGNVRAMQARLTLFTLYSSCSLSQVRNILHSAKDEFIQKPPVFTEITASKFSSRLDNYASGLLQRQRRPDARAMVKMVGRHNRQKIIAIASSTGGTNALEQIIKRLPVNTPPILIVQHMPSGFTQLFAERLNSNFPQEIKEAESGDFLLQGRILLAPADRHMKLTRTQSGIAVECYVGTRIHGVMPAADILFESIADIIKPNAVGVVLTGMGSDGARGLLRMKNAGCKNICQNEATSVVYGMPKAAKDLGAIDYELPIEKIAEMMLHLAGK
ncbi:MAG: CheB methylesterase domain-containing protein [Defluviitaleaceae bacterium]|nr:CheB methylesterase domain-containing protein [Defluviitaleaceae bacterium]